MNKLTKALVSGLAIAGCAIGLAGCGNQTASQMNNIQGSYMQNDAAMVKGVSAKQKEYAPITLYHVKGHKIYAQNIQPHMQSIMQKQIKNLEKVVPQQLAKVPSSQRQQAKISLGQRINLMMATEREHPRAYQVFNVKSVKKHGDQYNLHGVETMHAVAPTQTGKFKRVSKKLKPMTLKCFKTSKGIRIVPHNKTSNIKSNPLVPKVSTSKAKQKLGIDNIKPSQDCY